MIAMTAALVLFAIALAPTSALAQGSCSASTLKGQYLFTGRGYIEPGDSGTQRVHRGMLVMDGAGR